MQLFQLFLFKGKIKTVKLQPDPIFRLLQGVCSLILFLLPTVLSGQPSVPVYNAQEEIVVTASRLPLTLPEVSRSVLILDRATIANAPVANLTDLLEYAAGVDIRQQGVDGMQADVSIRGASFEQTLVLINGVKVSDPQTGHHNLHLPVELEDVKKIEILKGQGSRLYGPNAFGGVINIITRNTRQKQVNLRGEIGANNLYGAVFSASAPIGQSEHRVSLSTKKSDGYRENTDFENYIASLQSTLRFAGHEASFLAGHTDKAFGANSFYGSAATRQWEQTQTTFLQTGLKVRSGNSVVAQPVIHWRRNKDHYLLDRENPERYENFHTTNVFGAELQTHFKSVLGVSAAGGEFSRESIESNRLGAHHRQRSGIYFEQSGELFSKARIALGASAFYYSDWGWQAWPSFDFGYQITSANKFYLSFGRAFRAPTYTELYYSSPSNRGNPDLRAEKGSTWEAGHTFSGAAVAIQTTFFKRNSEEVIDWVFSDQDSLWRARNITSLSTVGFDVGLQWAPSKWFGGRVNSLSLEYAYLTTDKASSEFITKYTINHLRHQAIFGLEYGFFLPTLTQTWKIRYEDRLQFDDHFLVDTRIAWQLLNYRITLDITNLFDQDYFENGLVPMPGRRLRLTVGYSFVGN